MTYVAGKARNATRAKAVAAAPQSDAVRDIGAYLRTAFADAADAELPDVFAELLAKLGEGEEKPVFVRDALPDAEFKTQLGAGHSASARIRPLAVGQPRSRRRSGAGDAAQGVGRARPVPGRHQHARVDLHHPRNLFLSQMRRARFKGEWDDFTADRLLAMPAGQDRQIDLSATSSAACSSCRRRSARR